MQRRKTKELECKTHGVTTHKERTDRGRLRWKCGKCEYEAVKRRRKKLKEELVAYKGGACESCGYFKCLQALEFHHRDPTEKDFQLGTNLSLARMKEEADKCLLLCANCHREEHERLRID